MKLSDNILLESCYLVTKVLRKCYPLTLKLESGSLMSVRVTAPLQTPFLALPFPRGRSFPWSGKRIFASSRIIGCFQVYIHAMWNSCRLIFRIFITFLFLYGTFQKKTCLLKIYRIVCMVFACETNFKLILKLFNCIQTVMYWM